MTTDVLQVLEGAAAQYALLREEARRAGRLDEARNSFGVAYSEALAARRAVRALIKASTAAADWLDWLDLNDNDAHSTHIRNLRAALKGVQPKA
jgi:hypothetical protein